MFPANPQQHYYSMKAALPASSETASSNGSVLDITQFSETTTTTSTTTTTTETNNSETATVRKASNLSLLEHVNFNVPNHDYILDFYLHLMGFGLDPRVAVNLMPHNDKQFGREGLIWASCGPNQFHFPRCIQEEEKAQKLYGRIGLRYTSLIGLQERLENMKSNSGPFLNEPCLEWYNIINDSKNEKAEIQIQDRYGNVFICREGSEKQTRYQQPVVKFSDIDTFEDVAIKYGVEAKSECLGIEYLEFDCQVNTAQKIANFYETIFDATTFVKQQVQGDELTAVAYICIGEIDPTNTQKAEQYLIFRETLSDFPPTDGHHIALYIGTHDTKNFEKAFCRAHNKGLLSTNWRDKVDVFDLEGARSQSQFRIQDILDLETGETIFKLEHELRSITHPTWPGKNSSK